MTLSVCAPFAAHVMPLSEVPDPVFASGVVGGGCALIPDSASECLTVHSPINGVVGDGRARLPNADASCITVCSPIAGVVTKLKPHAAIITSTQGISILIHLGIDTVSLHGKGFAALVDEGDVVAAGTPLIHWDLTPVHDADLSLCVPIVVVTPPSAAVTHEATGPDGSALAPLFSTTTN